MIGRSDAARRSAVISAGPSSSSHMAMIAARTSRPCGPCNSPSALSAQAAPTTLHPARAAIAVKCRRSLGSASTSSNDRKASSRIAHPPMSAPS